MATQPLPSNLYSGYAQVVDTRPSLAFAARLLAQRQAREDAFNKYFSDISGKVTSTGMRHNEIPSLIQARDNFKNFTIANKREIMNGNPEKVVKWNELKNTMMGVADSSKASNGTSEIIRDVTIKQPDIRERWDDQTVMPLIDKHEQPTYIVDPVTKDVVPNPEHEDIDPAQLVTNPKEYNAKDFDAHTARRNSIFKFDAQKVNTERNPQDPYSQIQTTTSSYTKPTREKIAQWEVSDYDNDARLRQTFKKSHNLLNTPVADWRKDHIDEYDKLNSVFKSATDKDIETDGELWAATQLATLPEGIDKTKVAPDWGAKELHKDNDFYARYNYRLDHPLPNNALFLSENTGNALDAMSDADFTGRNLIIKGGVFYNRNGTPKTGKVFITGDKLPTAVRSALKSGGVDPKYLISGVDGVVENGVLQNISNDLMGTVSRDDMEGVFQRKLDTEPLKGERLRFAEKRNTPPAKKTKRRSLDSFIIKK